jgi:vancomycin resistance protein YoaR
MALFGGIIKMAYRHKRRNSVPVLIVVLVVLLLAGGGIGYYVLNNLGPDSPITAPGSSSSATAGEASPQPKPGDDKIHEGVFVDGIALGGLTVEQAKDQVEEKHLALVDSIDVELTHEKGNKKFTAVDVTYSFDTDEVLQKAFQQGREGTKDEQAAFIEQLPANPVKLETTLTIDPSAIEQTVRDYASTLAVAPVDAVYKSYDATKPEGQRFIFTADVPGSKVDPDALWQSVKQAFTDKAFGPLVVTSVPEPAAVTVASLQENLKLIGHFSTTIRNHSATRLTNIRLVSKAVNGKILMPGETLSVNDSTGPRTAAKGYQKAPIDNNGIEDVGLGGGACQVSGTLYNAAISAGPSRIKIVERNHHSIPSAYMAKGTDATVDYGSKDLKIKNISDKPIVLIMYYAKSSKGVYTENAEIYGLPDPEGATYKLVGKIVKTIPGDTTRTRYVPNSALKPGETKTIAPHKGYVVDVYLVKTAKDGTVTQTKLYQDKYNPDCIVVAWYKDDPKPTPTPSTTPTPSATATPKTAKPTPVVTSKPPASSEPPAPPSTDPTTDPAAIETTTPT